MLIFLPKSFIQTFIVCTFAEDQQALEDEGLMLTMKPALQMPNRNMITQPSNVPMFNTAPTMQMVPNQYNMGYAPQSYFGQHAIATPGFIANNFPMGNGTLANEPSSRRKSIIENINPLVSEQKMLPVDLSMFPVGEKLLLS